MVSFRAKGYTVYGDFPSGKIMVYPSHLSADVIDWFRKFSYSKASTSIIAASSGPLGYPMSFGESRLAGTLLESKKFNMAPPCSMTANGGLGICVTVGGVLWLWLAGTLHMFVNNLFDDIQLDLILQRHNEIC